MTTKQLEAVIASINHDYVSLDTEKEVGRLFQLFSERVGQINRDVTDLEVQDLIISFQNRLPYLGHARILKPGVARERDIVKPYKNFQVTFQNAIVWLGRTSGMSNEWVFYYTINS